MVIRSPLANFWYLVSFVSSFYGVYVKARGRPENAGDGAEAGTTVMATDTVSIITVSSSSSTNMPFPVSSPTMSPSSTSNTALNSTSVPSSPSPPSPSVDPNFPIFLSRPLNSTTCENATFFWTLAIPSFNSTNKQMDIYATNEDVDQMPFSDKNGSSSTASDTNSTPVFDPDGDGDDDGSFPDSDTDGPDTTLNPQPPQPSHTPEIPISLLFSNATVVTSGELTVPALTLPQGWYVLAVKSDFTVFVGLDGSSNSSNMLSSNTSQTHLIIRSSPFYVTNKGNTSCIPSALIKIAQQNQNMNISTLPLSSGALAGTIVGCIVGVAVLVGACLLPRVWRRGVPGHKAWKGKGKLYHVF